MVNLDWWGIESFKRHTSGCVYRVFPGGFIEKGRSALNMGSTILWSRFLDWVNKDKVAVARWAPTSASWLWASCAPCSCRRTFPTIMDWTLRLWVRGFFLRSYSSGVSETRKVVNTFFFFWTGFYNVALVVLELAIYSKMVPSIKDVCNCIWSITVPDP